MIAAMLQSIFEVLQSATMRQSFVQLNSPAMFTSLNKILLALGPKISSQMATLAEFFTILNHDLCQLHEITRKILTQVAYCVTSLAMQH